MVVHPGAGNRKGTLANALLYRRLQKTEEFQPGYCSGFEGLRPGIVHRLDKDTSGVIIAAWDDEALAFLSDQFKARKVLKSYAALVQGCPKEKIGCVNKRIIRSRRDRKIFTVSDKEGRPSLTYYRLVKSYGNYSLLLLRPKTGRTHQIRLHLKYLGNPVLGDPLYGRTDSAFPSASLMLHAKKLSLILPGHKTSETFKTALPVRFREIISRLDGD
jgi:23S rRNA pseudouridine1911/1915/1917 synthase